tara:strand:- start:4 stop:111 length:108 start_codon:yes stop_codon:yes gene_type:complete
VKKKGKRKKERERESGMEGRRGSEREQTVDVLRNT